MDLLLLLLLSIGIYTVQFPNSNALNNISILYKYFDNIYKFILEKKYLRNLWYHVDCLSKLTKFLGTAETSLIVISGRLPDNCTKVYGRSLENVPT